MASLTQAESKKMYSWWWDSHISPKNSKWLHENLTDMDTKVKAMIKLIEEDADSFRKRAEMYYRKRPELMKLVEEFYRAYRALAERYDHATGALRQAHRTMAEAFPDQIPLVFNEESPPVPPEILSRDFAFFDSNGSQKDTPEKFANGGAKKGGDLQNGEWKDSVDKLQQEVDRLSDENQNLRNQIAKELERADKADAEVGDLKGTISRLESEKADVSLQYRISIEKISCLEADISRIQQDFLKVNDEMTVGTGKLRSLEDRCNQLEEDNRSSQVNLDMLKQAAKELQEQLNSKQEELDKANIQIREEHERCVQAEVAHSTIEKLHSQSQEQVRSLALDIENWVKKLTIAEMSKVGLEEEIQRLKEEIGSLNEQSCFSASKISSLQDEIRVLEESKRKLEDEVGLYTEEKKSLQQEIISVKADKKELEKRHHQLTDQIGAVNLNVESLQAMVKGLRDGNIELKDLCKQQQDERIRQLESLKFVEKITERNTVLENSLKSANVELEELRAKVKALEEACEALHGKISVHIAEKAVLVSQIEAIARNMENLSENNTVLENSLSDVNVELESLRGKLNALEESYQSLCDQNSGLLAGKSTLVTQVKSISQSLEDLERRYAELEDRNLNLERERDHANEQLGMLHLSLGMQQEKYEALVHSTRSQLDTLEHQISFLQNKGQLQEEELEIEQFKIINAQTEIFVLQRALREMREKNILLSDECQKYLETSSCQEEEILKLKQESGVLESRLALLSECNERLLDGAHQVKSVLNISKECQSPDTLNFEHILREIDDLKSSISNLELENHHLVLEKSVLLTLLQQYGLDISELQLEKNALQQELKTRNEELSDMQSEKCQLMELNEEIKQDMRAGTQREEVLNVEMEILRRSLSELQEAHSILQSDVSELTEENRSSLQKINGLMDANGTLEANESALLEETLYLEHLCLIFRSLSAERASELQLLHDNMGRLSGFNGCLEEEIKALNEKLAVLEAENVNLKELILNLEECKMQLVLLEDEVKTSRNTCQELNLQVEEGKNLLAQKDIELLQSNHIFQAAQDKNTELSGKIEDLMAAIDEVKAAREELEQKNFTLQENNSERGNEIAHLHHTKDCLSRKLGLLSGEVEDLKEREKQLTSKLEDGVREFGSCEAEIETLYSDLNITNINAAVFEEKMLELLVTCEGLKLGAMVEKEMFYEEISRRDVFEDELKESLDRLDGENRDLKEELGAYLPLISSLGDLVTSLEQRIRLLASHNSFSSQKKKDESRAIQYERHNEEDTKDQHILSSFGIAELQKLHAKVDVLEEVVVDVLNHLERDTYLSMTTIQAATRETEEFKPNGTNLEEEPAGKDDIVLHLKRKEEAGDDLQKGSFEIFEEKTEEMMKDIQLDHVLSSPQYENGANSSEPSIIGGDETNDQAREVWETKECNKMAKPSPVTSERDLHCHQIKVVEEERIDRRPSKPTAGRQVSTKSHDGNISQRLAFDAQRLSVLQKSAKDLKKNMEQCDLSGTPTSYEFKKLKAQLKEAEAAILQLSDTNGKLTRRTDKLSVSSNSLTSEEINEIGNSSERKIAERAKRGSEKIGRLELELQKLEYIWLKLKEEHDYRLARAAERRTRVLLRDYIYGRRESPKRKKVHCCACMRPRTKDE